MLCFNYMQVYLAKNIKRRVAGINNGPKVGLRTHYSKIKVVESTSLLILFAMQLCHVLTTCRFTKPEHQVQGCWSQQLTKGRTKDTPLLHQSGGGYVITNTVCNAAMPCPNYMQVYLARTSSAGLLEPATDPRSD